MDIQNHRKATRFIRKEIKSYIVKVNLLGFKDTIDCKLIDINSTGVQICTLVNLKTNYKLRLLLQFPTGHEFDLKVKIARCEQMDHYLSDHVFPSIKDFLHKKSSPLKTLHLFESNKQITAKYRNLSSTSVKIMTDFPLNEKKQHFLLFTLENGETHEVYTQAENLKHQTIRNYGLKFDKFNDELGEYLLETQTDLIFK